MGEVFNMSDSALRRYTLMVKPENVRLALEVARDFLRDHPNNHRAKRPETRGVIFKFPHVVFYAYGDAQHVRVKEEERNG
jgi:hypothetical protein